MQRRNATGLGGRVRLGVMLVGPLLTVACDKTTTALDLCHRLSGAGVATNCRPVAPATGLGSAALERADFDLLEVPEHEGSVYRFQKVADYEKAVDEFAAAAALVGPNRYGSRKALVFVLVNSDAPSDIAANAKSIVDAL